MGKVVGFLFSGISQENDLCDVRQSVFLSVADLTASNSSSRAEAAAVRFVREIARNLSLRDCLTFGDEASFSGSTSKPMTQKIEICLDRRWKQDARLTNP